MKFSSFIRVIFLIPGFMVFSFSCNRNNKSAVENVVYYYPEKNIYYDKQQAKYYYSLDGAMSWDSMTFNGAGYGAVLGVKLPIKKTGDNVWVNNESHRKEFKGVLLNIVNVRTISLSKVDSIKKLNRVVIIKARPEVIEKEPPEKGLKKFFNKLFGKKKKHVEEKKQ
ncbi:MAG: hypothetical protein ABI760_14960 [Ferruginibacter sp.]